MVRMKCRLLPLLILFSCSLTITLSSASFAQKKIAPRGILRVVDLWGNVPGAVQVNNAEGLVELDKDNKFVPCLAESWRWIDKRTIEFRLRRGVSFHNGEKFDADAVRINWEAYRKLKSPNFLPYMTIPDKTVFEIVNEYIVRFTFPEPDGLALPKFGVFRSDSARLLCRAQVQRAELGDSFGTRPLGDRPIQVHRGWSNPRKAQQPGGTRCVRKLLGPTIPKGENGDLR